MNVSDKASLKFLLKLTELVYEQGDVQLMILRCLAQSPGVEPAFREQFLTHIARIESGRDQADAFLRGIREVAKNT